MKRMTQFKAKLWNGKTHIKHKHSYTQYTHFQSNSHKRNVEVHHTILSIFLASEAILFTLNKRQSMICLVNLNLTYAYAKWASYWNFKAFVRWRKPHMGIELFDFFLCNRGTCKWGEHISLTHIQAIEFLVFCSEEN